MDWIKELQEMPPEKRKTLTWNDPRLSKMAEAVEKKYGLPEGIVRAVKFAENTGYKDGKLSESSNTSLAKSQVGAEGVMQFMPATRKLQKGLFEHNPLDPVENIDAAGKYLQYTLKNQYKGNALAAIADYNGGPEQAKLVMQGKKPKAPETDNYLAKVSMFFEKMQKEGGKK
jgi:soluble lytic murein transglycosylase-like protein